MDFRCGVVWGPKYCICNASLCTKPIVAVCIWEYIYSACVYATVAVTEDRLAMLQTQVQSLIHHQVLNSVASLYHCITACIIQNKLEDELKQIENKFEERKRKIAQEQENFSTEIKKVCT